MVHREALAQHTEVRWLSRGKVLRDELKVFFSDHNIHFSDRLHDDEFLIRLAYLGDAFSHLNDLNLGLQLYPMCEAMIKKLECFSVCINKDNAQVFPSLCDFFGVQMNSSLRTMSNVI